METLSILYKTKSMQDSFRACERLHQRKIPFDYDIIRNRIRIRVKDDVIFQEIMSAPVSISYGDRKNSVLSISSEIKTHLDSCMEYLKSLNASEHTEDGYFIGDPLQFEIELTKMMNHND